MTKALTKGVEVFYSYAHKDEKLRDELAKRLNSLQRQGLITQWYDRQIGAGTEWAHVIDTHLNTASVILLLVSPDFINSNYCYDIEMRRAMERHDANEARVIPIILRSSEWQNASFAKLQALPTEGKPITTWDNQDEAFFDVVRGIRKAIEEWTTPTSSIPSEQPWNVPYQRNTFFTGQEAILSSLHEKLRADMVAALTQPQAISGLGGIGKTQIAIEYAYRHGNEYRAVFWARADSHESLVQDYVALANLLHLPKKDAQDQNITVGAVIRWLDTHDQWLLILDNADDIALVHDVLPLESNGHILLTTRSQLLGTIARNVKVDQMGGEDGTLLLLKRAGLLTLNATLAQAAAVPDSTAAGELVQILGGLPLALDQAGAYINGTGCGVLGYLKRYRTQRSKLLKRRGRPITDYPESVTTTWSLSLEKVEQLNLTATELLQFCAFLHPDAIPEEIITEGASALDSVLPALTSDLITLDEAMEVLRAYSLVHRDANMKTLSIHRLVQAVLMDRMSENEQRQWAERVVRAVNRAFPDGKFATWQTCEHYLPHVLACAGYIDQWNMSFLDAAKLLDRAGFYLQQRAQYDQGELLLQRALAIHEQTPGMEPTEIAASLNRLARLYQSRGKFTQAEPLLKRALVIREQALGLEHPDTASSLNNLGGFYCEQGRFDEGEPLFKQVLAIRERVLGSDHPDTASSLNNLGAVYLEQGKFTEAEPLLKQALTIRERLMDPEHPEILDGLNNLAVVYYMQGKFDETEPLLQRVLATRERVLGPEHPGTASSLDNLAELYREEGKFAQAEPLAKRALAIRELVLEPGHPYLVVSLNNMAPLYKAQGQYDQAEPYLQRALNIREQPLGPEHLSVAPILENYADLLQKMGRKTEAAELEARIQLIRTKHAKEKPQQ